MIEPTINDAQTIAGGGGMMLAGRYRIVRQLGQGGMGSVWLAEDTQLDGKRFAIKMLPSILVSNKRAYNQLKSEALVSMKLTHPNIVTLRAFEENNGNPFLVMDYIDGQTLDDYLAEHGGSNLTQRRGEAESQSGVKDGFGCGLPEEEVIRVLRPIAAALDYAHSEGVIHRDVKPANVMIRKDGHPFILDFGIAREIQETLTHVTGKLSSGTLLYMSPEQLNGEMPKPAQDIYSFAAMVYECLKGEPPFVRGAIEDQIKNKVPEPPVGAGVPLACAVMAGLAKKPEDRPATCTAVVKISAPGSRVSGAKSIARYPLDERRKKIRRQFPAANPSASPIGGSVAAGTPSSLAKRPEPSRVRVPSPLAPTRTGWKLPMVVASLLGMIAACGVWFYGQHQAREREQTTVASARLAAERQAAADIRIEAFKLRSKVERLSDEAGFRRQKALLEEAFAEADALFDEKIKRWTEAAQAFSNYVTGCESLIRLDDARQAAISSRKRAQDAFWTAQAAKAPIYAVSNWEAAVAVWNLAIAEFGRSDFSSANGTFADAVERFGRCTEEANAVGTRQKVSAAARQMFEDGRYVELLQSAETKDSTLPEVQYLQGLVLIGGLSGTCDYAKAVQKFAAASSGGYALATVELGTMHCDGIFFKKDMKVGMELEGRARRRLSGWRRPEILVLRIFLRICALLVGGM